MISSSYLNNALLLSAILIAFIIAKALLQTLTNPINSLPGPWYTKYTNLPLKLSTLTGRRVFHVHALHQKYGRYVRIAPNEVSINDPTAFKQIHSISSAFDKSTFYRDFTALDRPILFTMVDRKSHAARRKLFAQGFSKTNLRSNWESVVKGKIQLAVSQILQDAAQRGGKVDVFKWFIFMASDISSHVFFGESFHTLEKGEANDFIRALKLIAMGQGIGYELPLLWEVAKRLPFKKTKEMFAGNAILGSYANLAVRNMKAVGGEKNIFTKIQAETEKGAEGALDDMDVQNEAIDLFIAGTDTTAITLTYIVWAVVDRPKLRNQVEEEVASLPEDYTDADVEKLPLLNAVIEESLRLYGAVPSGLPRIVPAGGVDMGGHFLPQGATVFTQAYTAHRDPELFPDPLEFNPYRWLADPSDKIALSPAAKAVLSPFGSGARSCLGIHLAYSELRLASAEFFRRCAGSRLAESTTPESMEFENFFNIAPRAHRCEVVLK